jgi:hypothetical protein
MLKWEIYILTILMKLFSISISVITEITVSLIQKNEWAKCIPEEILITDEDGKMVKRKN